MAIIIGRYRIRLEFFKQVSTQNDVGEFVNSRVSMGKVWAEFVDNSGSETFQASEITANRFATFNIRALSLPAGIDENCFVKYKGLYYDIVSFKEIQPSYKNIIQMAVINKDNAQ